MEGAKYLHARCDDGPISLTVPVFASQGIALANQVPPTRRPRGNASRDDAFHRRAATA